MKIHHPYIGNPTPLTHQNASTSRISSIKKCYKHHPPPTTSRQGEGANYAQALGLGPRVLGLQAYCIYRPGPIQVSSSYHKISARYTRAYQQGFPYGKFGGESQKKHRQVLGGGFYGEKFGGGFMGGISQQNIVRIRNPKYPNCPKD